MTRYASIIRKGRDLTQVAFSRILGKAKPTTEKDIDVLIHVAGYQLPKARQVLSGASPGYRSLLRKGDYEGHPFRGNQWTDGEGGGGEEPVGKVNEGRFVFPEEIEDWNESEFKVKIGKAATAQEIFGTIAGEDFDPKQWSVITKIEDGKKTWGVQGRHTTIHGTPVEWVSRYFDMESKDVYHDYLRVKLNSAGGSMAARLLGDSLALYDKMGMKTITTQASLEMGAYTWAKYGFAYRNDDDRKAHIEGRPGTVPGLRGNMQDLIRSTVGVQNLTPEQKREVKMIGDLLATEDLRVNQMLVDLKTPALDEAVRGVTQEYLKEGSSFVKHMFYNTDYKARISLDKNSPDRKRMEAHIRSRKNGARKFDEDVKLGYTVIMKSKPQTKPAGGDFHCLKNGVPSNGEVMNYLLGEEPDVSETSAELAKKLGLPEDLIKALGGK